MYYNVTKTPEYHVTTERVIFNNEHFTYATTRGLITGVLQHYKSNKISCLEIMCRTGV